uniref:polynucleotide adenylyltransferase n=1 Tax=Meloidogyne enterolobii TaxID=390850 RepID=A0A6V7X1I4_MELEN|nr:unnamed protein product [Meloidogyne enterolobii]
MKFGGFEFDLLFVTLKANSIYKYFKEENSLTVTQVDEAIKELTQNFRDIDRLSPKRRGMILALSGLRANLRVIELLKEKGNLYKFRLIHITLKLWAKENFIYGGQFGFLSSSSLTVIICKIIIENPAFSTIFLIKYIFEYLIKWIELPLDKEKIINLEEEETESNKIKEKSNEKPIWKIISPGFPVQNVGFNINKSTEKIIEKEIKNGIVKFDKLQEEFKELIKYEDDKEKFKIFSEKIWKNWFNGGKFYEKV